MFLEQLRIDILAGESSGYGVSRHAELKFLECGLKCRVLFNSLGTVRKKVRIVTRDPEEVYWDARCVAVRGCCTFFKCVQQFVGS